MMTACSCSNSRYDDVSNVLLCKVKSVLLATVHGHLILNGRHPLFRVWKGPGPLDDSDEEWAAASRISTQTPMQPVDEGVHVGQLLEDLFPSANVEQVGMYGGGCFESELRVRWSGGAGHGA
jgi:hypothetical protein